MTDHHLYDRYALRHWLESESAFGAISVLVFAMWVFSLYAVSRGWQ